MLGTMYSLVKTCHKFASLTFVARYSMSLYNVAAGVEVVEIPEQDGLLYMYDKKFVGYLLKFSFYCRILIILQVFQAFVCINTRRLVLKKTVFLRGRVR